MKNSILVFITVLAFNISGAQTTFKTTDLVDEFGDKIGEVQSNVAIGTFSNSATANSTIRVQSFLTQAPSYNTLEEYKEMLINTYTGKQLKTYLKYSKGAYELINNDNEKIRFDLYEYEDIPASMIGVKSGTISIKTENGTKIRATLGEDCFSDGSVTITGYKELTTDGAGSVKNKIKHLFYDWAQSDIYKSIVNASGSTDVVISFGNSTYKFTISNKKRLESDGLKCYVGTYLLHTDTFEIVVEIILKENRLMYFEKRGNRTFEAELHPLSSTKFFFKENNAIVHFNNTTNCDTPSFDISIDGETNKFIRK